jgi:hypothetical protein
MFGEPVLKPRQAADDHHELMPNLLLLLSRKGQRVPFVDVEILFGCRGAAVERGGERFHALPEIVTGHRSILRRGLVGCLRRIDARVRKLGLLYQMAGSSNPESNGPVGRLATDGPQLFESPEFKEDFAAFRQFVGTVRARNFVPAESAIALANQVEYPVANGLEWYFAHAVILLGGAAG